MDAKFTPGPYEAVEAEDEAMIGNEAYASHLIVTVDKTIHEGSSHVVVGAVAHIEHEVFDRIGTSEGNAKLWAAAPELYEALRDAQSALAMLVDANTTTQHAYAHVKLAESKARAAIAKAT